MASLAGPRGAVAVGPNGGAVAVKKYPPPPTVVVVRPPPPPPTVVVVVRPPPPPTVVVVVAPPPVGAMVVALPPGCATMNVGGIAYQNCGGAFYRPDFYGTQLVYTVVPPPYMRLGAPRRRGQGRAPPTSKSEDFSTEAMSPLDLTRDLDHGDLANGLSHSWLNSEWHYSRSRTAGEAGVQLWQPREA